MTAIPFLECQNVSFRYPAFFREKTPLVVDQVSLQVRPGLRLGIVGESGSGKSTLARLLAGLLSPVSGEILFEGVPVRQLRSTARYRYRNRVQILLQEPECALDPQRTVGSLLRSAYQAHRNLFGGKAQPWKSLARELLAVLFQMSAVEADPIDTWLGRSPQSFSGGQKRMLMLAVASMAMGFSGFSTPGPELPPRLLILDELFRGIDSIRKQWLLGLLTTLSRCLNITFFSITHDLRQLVPLADEVLVMHSGRVLDHAERGHFISEDFRPVLEGSYHPYTVELFRAIPRIDEQWNQ